MPNAHRHHADTTVPRLSVIAGGLHHPSSPVPPSASSLPAQGPWLAALFSERFLPYVVLFSATLLTFSLGNLLSFSLFNYAAPWLTGVALGLLITTRRTSLNLFALFGCGLFEDAQMLTPFGSHAFALLVLHELLRFGLPSHPLFRPAAAVLLFPVGLLLTFSALFAVWWMVGYPLPDTFLQTSIVTAVLFSVLLFFLFLSSSLRPQKGVARLCL